METNLEFERDGIIQVQNSHKHQQIINLNLNKSQILHLLKRGMELYM